MDFPLTSLHAVTTCDDGVRRGVRVQLQAADRIAVWTGLIDPSFPHTTAAAPDASDFGHRTVVHFIGWEQARAYYRDTPFAQMLDSLREQVLRLSTLPRSDDPLG